MLITLEQSLASTIRYVQDHSDENIILYFEKIPETFAVPSIYFPVPWTESKKISLGTYSVVVNFECWFLASTDWLAQEAADNVKYALLLDNCIIPRINLEGNAEKKGFVATEPSTKKIGDGTVRLSFRVKQYFSKAQEAVQAVNKIQTVWASVAKEEKNV